MILIGLLILAGGIGYAIVTNRAVAKKEMEMRYMQTSSIADALDIFQQMEGASFNYRHYVELSGTAAADEPVYGPYSKRQVAYYEAACFSVNEVTVQGSGNSQIRQEESLLTEEKSSIPFYLTDGSEEHKIYVDLESFGDSVDLLTACNRMEGPNSDFSKRVDGRSQSGSEGVSGSSMSSGIVKAQMGKTTLRALCGQLQTVPQELSALASPAFESESERADFSMCSALQKASGFVQIVQEKASRWQTNIFGGFPKPFLPCAATAFDGGGTADFKSRGLAFGSGQMEASDREFSAAAGAPCTDMYAFAGKSAGGPRGGGGRGGISRPAAKRPSSGRASAGRTSFGSASFGGSGAKRSAGERNRSGGSLSGSRSRSSGGFGSGGTGGFGMGGFGGFGTGGFGGFGGFGPGPMGGGRPSRRRAPAAGLGPVILGAELMGAGRTSHSRFLGYRLLEEVIPLSQPLYVLGEIYRNGDRLYIGRATGKNGESWFSTRPESEILKALHSKKKTAGGVAVISAVLALICIALELF